MRSISTKWMLRGIILFYRVGSARERRAAGRVTLCVLEGTSLCVSFIFLFLCDAKKRERVGKQRTGPFFGSLQAAHIIVYYILNVVRRIRGVTRACT